MISINNTGQLMYMLGLGELAIYGFTKKDIAMTRPQPLPEFLQFLNPAMVFVFSSILLISILVFYINRRKAIAIFIIANTLFWLVTTRHIFNLWQDHVNAFKSLWFMGGALLILTTLPHYQKYQRIIFWVNIIILSLFFVDCGISHFQYVDFVKTLIPDFIPFHLFFTYFAGVCLILGGVGLLIPKVQKWAALFLGIQIAAWFIFLHIPRAMSLSGDEWIGVGESLAVSGICFMLFSKSRSIA